VAVAGALLLTLGVPAVAARVHRRPQGFLPVVVVRNAAVVRSALCSSAVPAAWFALLIAVPAVLVDRGWSPLNVGLVLVPSAVTGILAPKLAAPVLVRLGAARSLALSAGVAALALLVAAAGASLPSAAAAAPVLVLAVMLVTFAFGLGQPALMAAVADAVPADVRGVALGVATLVFLVGGGVGSAVVGGLAEVLGVRGALLLLTALPIAGVLTVLPARQRVLAAA